MLIFFATRSKARAFSKGQKKVIDLLAKDARLVDLFRVHAGMCKRWGVKVA